MDDLEAFVNSSTSESQDAPPAASTPAPDASQAAPIKEAAPPTPEPVKPPPAPNQLKTLLEKEKALREHESRLKAYEREVAEYREARELAKSNPEALLEKLGVQIPGRQPQEQDPTQVMAAKLAQLEQYIAEQREREEKTQRAQAEETAKAEMKRWLGSVDDFHAVKEAGAEDLVFELIKSEYQTTGTVLSEEEAAREVEARLTELVEKLYPKLAAKKQAKQPQGTQPNTLTGSLVAAGGTPSLEDMSDDEALEYLVKQAR